MITAVVPAQSEEYRVGRVLESLLAIDSIAEIFIILNGSDKTTRNVAESYLQLYPCKISLVSFAAPLGIDVPRAVGAKLAYARGADYALFIDGDMVGEIYRQLKSFLQKAVRKQLDLALLDCYPDEKHLIKLQEPVFFWRYRLNRELGLVESLNIATPSHGLHIVSRRMLASVPWQDFAVPPTLLVHSVLSGYRVEIAGQIAHIELGSSVKNPAHNRLIIDTIIGDCLEALCLWQHRPRSRYYDGKLYTGYHDRRRFDLLEQFLAGRMM